MEEGTDEAILTSSRVCDTLTLGVVCQSACFPLHKRGAQGVVRDAVDWGEEWRQILAKMSL